MKAEITPRFSIGQKVWLYRTAKVQKSHDCPDCMGSKKWVAISPAGSEYAFACPRCATSYLSDEKLSLKYFLHTADTRELTIGSVRFNSEDAEPFTYMCKETGVGSGSVYRESEFSETRDEALIISAINAEALNQSDHAVVERFNKTLSLSDYEMHKIQSGVAA